MFFNSLNEPSGSFFLHRWKEEMNTKVNLTGIELDFPLYNGSGSFEYGDYQWTKIDYDNVPVLVLKTSELKSKITPEKRSNLMNTKGTQIFNSIGYKIHRLKVA